VTTVPADGSFREAPALTGFGSDLPTPPAETPPVLVGAASGVGASVAAMFVYQLLRIGWHLAHELTRSGAGAPTGLESPDQIFGVLLLGGLLSLAPAIFAGGVLGAVLAAVLLATRRHQGPLRAWLTGSLLAYVVALLVNVTVLARHRSAGLSFTEWRSLIGIPSVLFVLVFGGLGIYLHLRQTRALHLPEG